MTIQDLDKFIDSDMYNVNRVLQSYRSSEIPDILILSKLTNHPDFEKRVLLAETAPVQIWGWGEDRVIYPQELKKLVKYLREEVKPLENIETTRSLVDHKDIPTTLKKYLNQVVVEYTEGGRKLDWNGEYTFKFWLIEDNYELIQFLRFGLTSALSKMLDDVEHTWQAANGWGDIEEDDDELDLRERQELTKYPPVYAAIYDIFEFFAAFSFHGPSLIGGWGEEGMKNILDAFKFLGLNKVAEAYAVSIKSIPDYNPDIDDDGFIYSQLCREKIIPAFETIMEFNITQQHLDVAEAVRKNYQLFLV